MDRAARRRAMLEEMGLGVQWQLRPGVGVDPVASARPQAGDLMPPAGAATPAGRANPGPGSGGDRTTAMSRAAAASAGDVAASRSAVSGPSQDDRAASDPDPAGSMPVDPPAVMPPRPPADGRAQGAADAQRSAGDAPAAAVALPRTDRARGSMASVATSSGSAPAGGDPEPPSPRAADILALDWEPLADAVSGCTACSLARTRRCTVFGIGDRRARWMFVGEGPGAEEDATGLPFVGQAGRLLDSMLAALGLARDRDVFIANIVKCRPPGNRVPTADEVAACEPFLHRQIALVQPALIIALGKTAAVTLLGREQSIASMRGQVYRYRDTPLVVTYHPAYLLRNLPEKAKSWEDLCFARSLVRGAAQDTDTQGAAPTGG